MKKITICLSILTLFFSFATPRKSSATAITLGTGQLLALAIGAPIALGLAGWSTYEIIGFIRSTGNSGCRIFPYTQQPCGDHLARALIAVPLTIIGIMVLDDGKNAKVQFEKILGKDEYNSQVEELNLIADEIFESIREQPLEEQVTISSKIWQENMENLLPQTRQVLRGIFHH